MTNGLLLGKFLPFHRGHEYLINFARNHCEKLTIMVCTQSNEPIDGKLRYGWIKDSFPDVIVKWIKDDSLPQGPTDSSSVEDFRKCWINQAKKAADGMKIDFYYASEDYGHWMAEGLDAEHVPVDPKRVTFSVSGTAVRDASIYGRWNDLPPIVKAHYTKRVVMFGPESAGKTTMAKHLAEKFNTSWVPEYGRIYTDVFGGNNLVMKDFERIRAGHTASVKALLPTANRILIEDTDPLMTAVWCEMLTGSKWFGYGNPVELADLYLLLSPDLEWDDDGTRYFPDTDSRRKMYSLCIEYLLNRKANFVTVHGDGLGRFTSAEQHVQRYLDSLKLL